MIHEDIFRIEKEDIYVEWNEELKEWEVYCRCAMLFTIEQTASGKLRLKVPLDKIAVVKEEGFELIIDF
jgi:hypothetical protein